MRNSTSSTGSRHNLYRADTCNMNLRFKIETKRKIEKAAAARGMTLVGFVQWALSGLVEKVELTAEDYQIIAQRVRENEQRQKEKYGV